MIAILIAIGLVGGVAGKAFPGPLDEEKTPFGLEEILHRPSPKGITHQWIAAEAFVYQNITKDIMLHDFTQNTLFLHGSVLEKYDASCFELSPERTYLLLGHSSNKKFRHSNTKKYVVYSLSDESYTPVADNADLEHAAWAPNSEKVIYVKENNIYSLDMESQEVDQITKTGVPGLIFNGITDWVYEAGGNNFAEEVIGKGSFLGFSPDGEQMYYGCIDDSNVTENVFMRYGKPGDVRNQYAEEVRIRYPKTGTPIPTYKIYHYNFTDRMTTLVTEYKSGHELLVDGRWITNSLLALAFANRVQNVTEIELCDTADRKCKKVDEDRNPNGWSVLELPVFSTKGDRYLSRKRQKVGGEEYYHIHLMKTDGSERTVLTNGTFMVRTIQGWDEVNKVVYYIASEGGKPWTNHLYAVSESGKESPFCVSCQMTASDGSPCTFLTMLSFGSEYKTAIGQCGGPTTPFVATYTYSADRKLTLVQYLEKNCQFRRYMRTKLQPTVMDLQVPVTKTIKADVRLFLPPKMDSSGKKKYPMIIYVYGGPDNPQVTDRFRFDWSLYLTSNRSIIYGIIDGRGTGRRGTKMMYAMYRSFGAVEIQDQITAVKYLHEKFNFIDKNNTGIWGWSYGGYATTKVLENDVDGAFKCGVAGAPVTDWLYYNSVYTERYMDLPSANPKAYRESSTLYNVENLRKKKYFLIHGTGDDNVHYQHAMALAKVLQSKNIMFEQAAYPDEDHGFYLPSKIHMTHMMDRFFENCFGLSH